MFDFELPEKYRRYVPLVIWVLVAFVVLAIPLKIIGLGYLPYDDALRHAAKAVSGKPWPEILVVGDSFKLDHNLGWHALLGAVHQATGWNAENLVLFSVVVLFLVVNGALLPWLKRPEAWLIMLLVAVIISDLPERFMFGRPFLLTIAVLMTILSATQKLKPGWPALVLFTALITACTFVHGVWYLWLLPVAAFFFAGQFRWMFLVAAAWLAGAGLAALLTGHPMVYLSQAITMALSSTGQHATNRTEVTELQPFDGNILAVMVVGVLVLLRAVTKSTAAPLTKSPAFWLVCGCWILAFRVGRFWEDWGWPALMVLAATELDFFMDAKIAADSWRRLVLAVSLALATFLAVTSDLGSRWTRSLTWSFLTPDAPELAGWLPDKGGIFYCADMNLFYQTFFKNPNADWKYILGYEPSLMPADDFKTYQKILWNLGDAKAYKPWLLKMKLADRLIIPGGRGNVPNIPQLEWNYGASGIWLGRLPNHRQGGAPVTIPATEPLALLTNAPASTK
jgi:hypothetical protein